MSRKTGILKRIGKLSGILAVTGLVLALPAYFVLFVLPIGSSFPIGMWALYLPVGAFLLGSIGWLVSKLSLRFIVTEGTEEDAEAEEVVRDSGYYLKEFNKANRYVAIFFSFLLIISLSSSSLTSAVSGTPLEILVGFLVFGAELLGGTWIHLVNTVWFAGSWHSINKYNSTEAWLTGFIGWSLFTISGLLMLSSSIGAIAIIIAGLKVLSYAVKSRGETEIRFVEDYISGTKLEKYIEQYT